MTTTSNNIRIPVIGKSITFNQFAAFIVLLVIVWVLVSHPALAADVKQALIGIMMLCAGYIWGSSTGSHAKDDALANSTPIAPQVPDAKVASTTTTTVSEK